MRSLLGLTRAALTFRLGRHAREYREAALIRHSGVFDEARYLHHNPDVASIGLDPVLHYLRHGADEGRWAHPYFDEAWYLQDNPDVATMGLNPLVHFLTHGIDEGRPPFHGFDLTSYLARHQFCLSHGLNPLVHFERTTRLIAIIHAFYIDVFEGILRSLESCDPSLEIHVTCPPDRAAAVRAAVDASQWRENIRVWEIENRGRDVRPFLVVADALKASDNDVVVKVHTKKSPHRTDGDAWRSRMIDQLLDRRNMRRTLAAFAINPQLGMVGPEGFIFPVARHYFANNEAHIQSLLRRTGWEPLRERDDLFVGGSMFFVRYRHLRPILDLRLGRDDFEEEAGQIDGTMAHALERLFGMAVIRHGATVTCLSSLRYGETVAPPPAPSAEEPKHVPRILAAPEEEIPASRLDEAQRIVGSCQTRFSVVMPTRNRRSTIGAAIDSVLAQSYAHFELIVSDDGSDDGTLEWIRDRYADEIRRGRIRCIAGSAAGVSVARNRALERATGEWIAYLDSDNVWRPDYLLFVAAAYLCEPWRRTCYAGLCVHSLHVNRVARLKKPFNWPLLAQGNYIDLNIFSHHRGLLDQLGAFDESLTRLVDWDLILRFTRLYPPAFIDAVLADYFTFKDGDHITTTVPLQQNWDRVRDRHLRARIAQRSVPLRLAYVLWDFPSLSQTFVLEEIRRMVARGLDVKVFFKTDPDAAATLDFDVEAHRFRDADHLAELLRRFDRNWVHSHFLYPAVTLAAFGAATNVRIPFSFMPHAVDLFHRENRARNRLREITNHPLCAFVLCYGPTHRKFLIGEGAPADRIIMSPQAFVPPRVASPQADPSPRPDAEPACDGATRPLQVVSIARFIEKKGIEYLIRAAAALGPERVMVKIYGYGPLESAYRSLIAGLEATNVSLHGPFRGDEERSRLLADADLFVLPCVEAENGDVDGFPTVFFEAMSAGLPVLTTTVSANGDFILDGVNGLLCPPRDVKGLVEAMRWASERSPTVRRRLGANARELLECRAQPDEVVDTFLDAVTRPPLDIVMVTHHPTADSDHERTLSIIERVEALTSTPFTLTIVDNASHPDFRARLEAMTNRYPNIRYIPLPTNRGCGPGCNVALSMGRNEFAVYLCSNEAFVARYGWERALLNYMRRRPQVGLGGHLVSSPQWLTAGEYARQPWFASFRAAEAASRQPQRILRHVQGGAFIIRRRAFLESGGFSDRLPNAQTDVEMSYYLETLGWKLADIPGVVSLTKKTRPTIKTLLDEHVQVAHPVTSVETERLVERYVTSSWHRCPITGWSRESAQPITNREEIVSGFAPPHCSSTGASRAIYRALANSHLIFRGQRLAAWMPDGSLRPILEQGMFNVALFEVVQGEVALDAASAALGQEPMDVVMIGRLAVTSLRRKPRPDLIHDLLRPGGSLIFTYHLDRQDAVDPSAIGEIAAACGCEVVVGHFYSRANGYGLAPVVTWIRKA